MANWEGYDREAEVARFAKVKEQFHAGAEERARRERSLWAIIYNVDLIQWRNNLMNAAAEFGLDLRMDEVKVLQLSEPVVEQMFDGQLETVWTLEKSGVEAGAETETRGFVTAGNEGFGRMLLLFQYEEDAARFAMNMTADGRGNVVASELPMPEVKEACVDQGVRIGFVTRSFIQPSHFGPGMIGEKEQKPIESE